MSYSLVRKDAGCGELDLFFVAGRLGVALFFGGSLWRPVEVLHFKS
jgi:hypothetical protein